MEPFKNAFSAENALRIANRVRAVHPEFPIAAFRRGLEKALAPLELKQRMHLIADRLEAGLPAHPPELFPILAAALARDESDTAGLRGFPVWPLTEIVARRGLDYFEESMVALREMTRCFTAEFAIRPFLRVHPERALRQMHEWTGHPDSHVRRLVSEGTRPLLPWGERLPALMADPHASLGLLEKLHRDESDYVRLSVSNHLNDFSKVHPLLVLATLEKWRVAAPADARFDKLARHACRTLVKQGHPGALAWHGFGAASALEIESVHLPDPAVKIGGQLGYRIVVRNKTRKPVRVLFDYAILHRKANGSLTPKVFKGRIRELAGGERWEIEGRHSLKPVTTRVYYPGLHRFEPRINGKAFPSVDFTLAPA